MSTTDTLTISRNTQPDIAYAPDYEKYRARVRYRLEHEQLDTTLPSGYPKKLKSDLVWNKDDIASRYDWVYELTPTDVEEIDEALRRFESSGRPLGFVDQQTFPLPRLHAKLREISKDLHHGFGFKVIRGVPIQDYTRKQVVIVYAGLASHVASVRGRQDHQYEGKPKDVVMNHVKDLSNEYNASKVGSPAYTTDKQVFHTDSGDVIALLCLEEAAQGGTSKLSSSWAVYNELAETRPDLIRTLAEDWPAELFDKQGAAYVSRPLLHYQPATSAAAERMIIQYARRTFTGFQGLPRSPDIPPITEAQAEALDALHFLAEKHALTLHFQKGDIQFVNNLSIFHARDAFTNTREKQRHLVRLWLRDEEFSWVIPTRLKSRFDKVFEGVRSENQVFPLEPYIRTDSLGKK